jgi:hypothetical protein
MGCVSVGFQGTRGVFWRGLGKGRGRFLSNQVSVSTGETEEGGELPGELVEVPGAWGLDDDLERV